MKRILSLLLSITMMFALVIPAGAVEVNAEDTNSFSTDSSTVTMLQQRLETKKADALMVAPATATHTNYDIETLKAMLIEVMNEIQVTNDSLLLQELEAEQDYLESQLALNDVLVLTDADLEMLLGDTQLVAHIDTSDSEPEVSPRSSTTAIVIPAETANNLWLYHGLCLNYEYPCYYVEASPKNSGSTLHNIRDEREITEPYGDLTRALISFAVDMAVGAAGTCLGQVALATAFGVAISNDSSSTDYSYEFEETLTVKCAFVYSESTDEYRCTLITHSDNIVYSHRAFSQGWKSYSMQPAQGQYFENPYPQAIARFNSGNYLIQKDRQTYFTATIDIDGEREELAGFIPIYIDAMSNVN